MLLHTFSSSFTVPALLEHELGIGNTILLPICHRPVLEPSGSHFIHHQVAQEP